MKTEFELRRAEQLITSIDNLESQEAYCKSRAKRQALSSLYKQIINVEGNLPKRPKSMKRVTADNLCMKTSTFCPDCLRPEEMERIVRSAFSNLYNYRGSLIEFVKDSNFLDLPEDVHQLRPNIDL